jgi:hypothetical protein
MWSRVSLDIRRRSRATACPVRARSERLDPMGLPQHDDRRQQALRALGEGVQVQPQQGIAGANGRAHLDQRFEAGALQPDRVDADVDQHLDAVERAQRHRVA